MPSEPPPGTGGAEGGDLEGADDARPLALVDEQTSKPDAAGAGELAADGREHAIEPRQEGRSGLPIWLFVVVLLGFSLILVWQYRQAGALQTRIAGLEQDLAAANRLVDAHQVHLQEIRSGVTDLSERMEGLRVLADRDPADRIERGDAATPGSPAP